MKSLPVGLVYTISVRCLKLFAFLLEGENNKHCYVLSVLKILDLMIPGNLSEGTKPC